MSGVTNDRLEANRIAQTIASALDHVGAYGNWRACPSRHCERSEECRSPHECAGRNRAIIAARVEPVVASAHQQIAILTARVAELEALIDYLCAERSDGRKPTIIDIAFTAFMRAKGKNDEDGGPTDWGNDTKPLIDALVAAIRARAALGGGE